MQVWLFCMNFEVHCFLELKTKQKWLKAQELKLNKNENDLVSL